MLHFRANRVGTGGRGRVVGRIDGGEGGEVVVRVVVGWRGHLYRCFLEHKTPGNTLHLRYNM